MSARLPLTALLALALGSAACAGVLGIRPPPRRPFEHHAHVTKGVSCNDCHAGVASAGEDDPVHIPGDATCLKCHQKPHDERSCAGCHGLPHAIEEATIARASLSFRHDKHVPRVKGDCARCHEGVTEDSSHVRPPMALCLSCHAHQDQVAERKCDVCHQDLRGEHEPPSDHLAHGGDFLRDHGTRASASPDLCSTCHADAFCSGCHGKTVAILPERMRFFDTTSDGVHRAGFFGRHGAEARAESGLCSTCHTVASCNRCHERRGVSVANGTKSPHPPGWVGLRGEPNDHGRAAWRDPLECASCHAGGGEALCVGCHKVGGVGGNPHRAGWSSSLRKTVDMPCRLCHQGAL